MGSRMDMEQWASGDLLEADLPAGEERDPKSGALMVPLALK
jgi:hypothetical protein